MEKGFYINSKERWSLSLKNIVELANSFRGWLIRTFNITRGEYTRVFQLNNFAISPIELRSRLIKR